MAVHGFTSAEVERARRYHRPLYLALVVDGVLGLAALAALTRVDLPLPWWAEVAAAPALVAVVLWLVRLPAAWWRFGHERAWGFARQDARGWIVDRLRSLAVSTVLTVLGVGGLLALAHLLPSGWPWAAAASGAVLTVVLSFVAPVVLEPVFNRFRPLEGELADRLRATAERAGAPVRDVLVADASRRTSKQNAYVSGLGRTRRVVVWDTLLETPPEEVALVVAHELGHRRMHHVAILSALAAAGAVVFVVLLRLVDARPAPHDAAEVLLLGTALELAALPALAGLSRRFERAADRFSLAVGGDPAVYASLHRRLALANLADLAPPRLAYVLLFTHPTPPERLGAAAADT